MPTAPSVVANATKTFAPVSKRPTATNWQERARRAERVRVTGGRLRRERHCGGTSGAHRPGRALVGS